MIKSMTGFGRGEYVDENHRFIVEIKAVNHRYNEVVIRNPKNLNVLEDRIRRAITGALTRGRVDVFISMDDFGGRKRLVRVDKELAMAYHSALKEVAVLIGSPSSVSVERLAQYPDVLRVDEEPEDLEILWQKLQQAILAALRNHLDMRDAEGANIRADLAGRVDHLEALLQQIKERAPQIALEYREKLTTRMRDILATYNVETDEGRLLQEAALFSDRSNVTEEMTRLESHIQQFRSSLDIKESVGRKLDFIVQEMNRETNTIASKANDYSLASIVVEMKSEIEKIREQIQNVE